MYNIHHFFVCGDCL